MLLVLQMQGILANTSHSWTIEKIAEKAYIAADELLKQEHNEE